MKYDTPAKIPHDPVAHRAIHITYRLHGSIPKAIVSILADRRRRALDRLDAKLLDLAEPQRTEDRNRHAFAIEGKYELAVEEALHRDDHGPRHLQHAEVARQVMESWLTLQQQRVIYLHAACVMSNHVHVILQAVGMEKVDTGKLMQRHKGYTARKANTILDRTGRSFWEEGYFDRRIRQGKFLRVMRYVVNNPVKAGLVVRWTDWPHTYVAPELREMFTGVLSE